MAEGDIINLDVSLYHNGMHGDLNATYPVGKVDAESADLIATTRQSMEEAIKMCKPGVAYREIGNVIESITKPKGYGVVRRYTGHGIHYLVCRFTRLLASEREMLTSAVPLSAQCRALCQLEDARTDGTRTRLYHRAFLRRLRTSPSRDQRTRADTLGTHGQPRHAAPGPLEG